jgi:hypothetical protein
MKSKSEDKEQDGSAECWFDHEKLEVCRDAVVFIA